MTEGLQTRLRRVVAEHLGVEPADVVPEASLGDALAVDSLDLVDLVLGLEAEFGVSIPERALAAVQTCGDLADVTFGCVRAQRVAARASWDVQVAVRLASPRGGLLVRAGYFTPALAETIEEDARRAGPGAQMDVVLDPASDAGGLARVEERLGSLRGLGVGVSVALEGLRLGGRALPEIVAGGRRPGVAAARERATSPHAA